jgi:hypothetical protein
MGGLFAAVYSQVDDLEHALKVQPPIPGGSAHPIVDITFSPATQGHMGPGDQFTPPNTLPLSAGAYGPVDKMTYLFFATSDNQLFWTRWPSPLIKNPPPDPILQGVGALPMADPLVGYPPAAIKDIAAFYSPVDGHLYLLVLMNNGDLYRLFGSPWTDGGVWSLIPFLFQQEATGTRICGFTSPGWNHAMVAAASQIIEVYFSANDTGQDVIWTFDRNIIDVSAFYTEDDGVAHVVAALPATAGPNSELHEVTFVPAQVPPKDRLLATVPFQINTIGAYVKPDQGRHVIMLETPDQGFPVQLYLSWYYPGANQFGYDQWPPYLAW